MTKIPLYLFKGVDRKKFLNIGFEKKNFISGPVQIFEDFNKFY